MIDSYLLEQLLAFYQTGTLSAAAEELLISQPALSQSMKKLEDSVGVPLFERQKNKTSFNDNGLLLVDYAQKIMALQEEMVSSVRLQASHQLEIHLASIAPLPLEKLASKISQIYRPQELTSQLLTDEDEMLTDLERDVYDIVITRHDRVKSGLSALPFFSEKLSLLVPKAHPLAKKDVLSFADLDGHNILLYSQIGFWMAIVRENLPSANFLYMENREAFTQLTFASEFPTFISNASTPEHLPDNRKIIPIDEAACQADFYLVYKKKEAYKWGGLLEPVFTKKC